ncbi:MAG TPA: efflux RND transporter periplasmic adaptor subunit [Clostridia bacterium]|nr:efflux RND transporter periplasmic adaptor subunit [Clostridia bacterium]
MEWALPKLRSDLISSQQQSPEGIYFIIKDPATGEFFRFGEAEQFIARQLDGATPLEVARQRTEQRFEAPLAPKTLSAFVRNLEKLGFLENSQRRKPGSSGRLRGSLLYLRVKAFDPDALFSRLVPRVRFFFTRQFLLISATLIVLAIGISIAQAGVMAQQAVELLRLSTIPLLLVTIMTTVAAHECAHGLTCKYFGGQVREMGFMLIYFQPAFYCNVSDAWLFPEKSKRLWVGLAGPYFELFVWALAALFWRFTDTETWINRLAFIVVASSGIKTLLNFNPFIKLDGYYLLSDYLEMPNLRGKAFRYIGQWVKRLAGSAARPVRMPTPRERRVYLGYGLVATICSLALLAWVAITAGGLLIEQQQPLSFALFAGLLGARFRHRFGKLLGKSRGPTSANGEGEELETYSAEAPGEPEPAKPKENKPEQKKRAFGSRRTRRLLVVCGLIGLVLLLKMNLRVGGGVRVMPIQNAEARAAVEGIVQTIHVEEGAEVRPGDLIAQLSGREYSSELRKVNAEIEEKQARLNMLKAGPRAEEIAIARTAVAKAEERLRYSQSFLKMEESLYSAKLTARRELELAAEAAIVRSKELEEAQGNLNVLLAGTRPEQIQASQAELNRLQAQRRFLEEQLRLLEVRSPGKGIVATPARQLKELRYQLVRKGDLIARIYDLETIRAEIAVSEKLIGDVKPGQPVVLKVRAYPTRTFRGKVTAIAVAAQGESGSSGGGAARLSSSVASSGGTGKTVLVTTEIDNRSLLLKPEMTGHAKVVCGKRHLAELLTRRLVRVIRVEFWSWW